MENILSAIRWILHKLFIALLGLTVWGMLPTIAVTTIITDSSQVKAWLDESNAYQNFLDEALSFVESKSEGEVIADKAKDSQIDVNALFTAVKPVVTTEFLQSQSEEFIDGVYAWLMGETGQPEFNLSLKEKAVEIEKRLTPELTKQLSELPVCSSVNQIPKSPDILEVECVAPVVPVALQAKLLANNFVNQSDGPIQTEFTGDDLNLSNSAIINMPVAYSTLELLPLFFWASLLAFAAITVLTARSWQKGLKEVGTTLLVASGLLIIIAFISMRLADAPGRYVVDPQNNDTQSESLRKVLQPIIEAATSDIARSVMLFSIIMLVIGLATFFVGRHYSPSEPQDKTKAGQKKQKVPELLRDDDEESNYLDKIKTSKSQKPKIRDKIKKRLIQ